MKWGIRMKKGCIFDLDGTLVNSLMDLAMSTNQVLKMHDLPTHDISEYNQFVGNGVKKLIERALPKEQIDLLEECLDEFYTLYDEHCLDYTQPYEGVKELIQALKDEGIKLSVVTNKPHHLAVKIVENLFPDTFESILGQQDLYPTKPHPESTFIALMGMKLRKEECYFIGDSNVDIQTGYQAEMDTIGVSWGFRGREELEKEEATYVVDKPYEIKEIIDEDRNKFLSSRNELHI